MQAEKGVQMTLPCLDLSAGMRVGGQRYAPLILYEWYFTRTKAHVLLQKHACLTDFLKLRRKPHVLYVLGYMPWW